MEKFMKKSEEKGITLIALIITIIVLIILAGISIVTLSGQNGILAKTAQAKVEECHGVVKEEINMMYTQYITDLKTIGSGITSDVNITKTTSYEDYLKLKGIIDDNGKVDIVKLTGGKKYLGNGTSDKDIYTLVSNDEENAYELKYSGEDGNQRELLTIAKDNLDGSIDYTKMESGLYKTGTNQMIMSWEKLSNTMAIFAKCCGGATFNNYDQNNSLTGDLIIKGSYDHICSEGTASGIIRLVVGDGIKIESLPVMKDLEELHFLGVSMITNYSHREDLISSLKKCEKLKTIYMSQACYDSYNWQGVVDAINENRSTENSVKIIIKNGKKSDFEKFKSNLPKDENERQQVLENMFIKAMNHQAIHRSGMGDIYPDFPIDTKFTTIQDVWSYLGNYSQFDNLQEFYDNVLINEYGSVESFLFLNRVFPQDSYNYVVGAYIQQILDELPTDENERWNKMTELFIEANNIKHNQNFKTLQELWNYYKEKNVGDFTKYTTLKEWFENEKSSSYSSMENFLINSDWSSAYGAFSDIAKKRFAEDYLK